MASVSQFYKLWLKPHHLPPQGVEVTIESARVETIHPRPAQEEQKIVLSFKGKNRFLILNDGNANKLADIAGDDFEKWAGVVIRLKPINYTSTQRTIVIEPVQPVQPAQKPVQK